MSGQLMLINKDRVFPFADFPLQPGDYVLGRSSECDLAILDPTISRQHARLRVGEAMIQVTDLGSRNGTFLNEAQIESASVAIGQQLRFGRVKLLFDEVGRYASPAIQDEIETADNRLADIQRTISELGSLLTPAQLKVIACLLQGSTEKDAASQLGISRNTVHNHIRDIYFCLKVCSRAELMARFINVPVAEILLLAQSNRAVPENGTPALGTLHGIRIAAYDHRRTNSGDNRPL